MVSWWRIPYWEIGGDLDRRFVRLTLSVACCCLTYRCTPCSSRQLACQSGGPWFTLRWCSIFLHSSLEKCFIQLLTCACTPCWLKLDYLLVPVSTVSLSTAFTISVRLIAVLSLFSLEWALVIPIFTCHLSLGLQQAKNLCMRVSFRYYVVN